MLLEERKSVRAIERRRGALQLNQHSGLRVCGKHSLSLSRQTVCVHFKGKGAIPSLWAFVIFVFSFWPEYPTM
eukprot:5227572-Amphidinium_carterae.1